MSPAAKKTRAKKAKPKPSPRRTIEEAVTGADGREANVRRNKGETNITWFCGEARRFTPEQLAEAIHYVEFFSDLDAWYETKRNLDKQPFVARMMGDQLSIGRVPGETNQVPWQPMKDALQAAIAEGWE